MNRLIHVGNLYVILDVLNPKSRKTVIFSHGFFSSKHNFFFTAAALLLAIKGFRTVLFNYASEHLSDRIKVLNSVILEASGDSDSIGLVGTSLGGMTSMLVTNNKHVRSLALINTVYNQEETYHNYNKVHKLLPIVLNHFKDGFLKYDLKKIVSRIKKPVLIISGTRDRVVPTSIMKELYNDLKSEKELMIIKGAGHSLRNPVHILSASRKLVSWFKRTL